MVMESTDYIGIAAGVCTAVSLLPQLVKIIREKKAENISYWMLGVLFAGLALWIFYGIRKNDYPIIVTNSISFVLNSLVSFFTIKYKKK